MDFELRVDARMLMCEVQLLRNHDIRSQTDTASDMQQLGEGCNDSVLASSTAAPKEVAAGAPEKP